MSTVLFKDNKSYPLTANVMVIDDQLTSRIIMKSIIKSIGDNIRVATFENAISALEAIHTTQPDLIIVDYKMPDMNGVEFTRAIRSIPECMYVPIIVFTIYDEKSVMHEALEAGATDFLTKPIDHYECKVRCHNLLTLRRQQIIIRARAASLEKFVHNTNQSFEIREKEVLGLINKITDIKGDYKGYHPIRIGIISMLIAKEMGMDKTFCDLIEAAAPLHDIGEIKIPNDILLKPEKLNEDELNIIREHTNIGQELLSHSTSPLLKFASGIAHTHHERLDGSGYPNKLKGNDIPIEGRIVAVADAYDAMTSYRSYRPAKSTNIAVEILNSWNKAYDPSCIEALVSNIDDIHTLDNNTLTNN
ncbi:MAG: two-component system response regulator RpfG [Gammaproteobacteria bacterium]|jgi:two-component system response regulator RpfG